MTNRIRRDVQRVTAVTKTLGLLRAKLHHHCYPLVANTMKMLICGCGDLACRVNFVLTNTETPAGGDRQGAGEGHPACPRVARQPVQGFCPDPERGRVQYRGSQVATAPTAPPWSRCAPSGSRWTRPCGGPRLRCTVSRAAKAGITAGASGHTSLGSSTLGRSGAWSRCRPDAQANVMTTRSSRNSLSSRTGSRSVRKTTRRSCAHPQSQ
jgi:hypothetical protein